MARFRNKLLAIVLVAVCCSSALAKKSKINLQWAICEQDADAVLTKLGEAGTLPYKAHNITYFDSSPPAYTQRGLAFRQKYHGVQRISMVKLRFDQEHTHLPANADCAWEQYGETTSYTCGVPSPLYSPTQLLWSDGQVAFVEQYRTIDWNSLVPYGPFPDPKWKFYLDGFEATFDDVTVNVAGTPLHLMEFEITARTKHQKLTYKMFTQHLEERGIKLCDEQLPKTERLFRALEGSSAAALNSHQILPAGERSHSRDWHS